MRQLLDFDLRLIRIFRVIVEAQGLAGAQVVLNLSQSRISTSLAELEARLGVRLCRRGRAGFALTDAGRSVYEASHDLFEAVDRFCNSAGTVSLNLKRVVKLGAVDALAKQDASAKKIAIVHENDKFSTDVSNALKAYAEKQGYQVVLFEGYDTNTTDFGPIINKVQQAAPDAILGGGHFQDGSTFARQLSLGRGLALDNIEAKYHNGVLTLTIPVAEEARPRKIAVSHGDDAMAIQGRAEAS